jgi:hypothetical protein
VVYADDVNLLGENMTVLKKNTGAPLKAGKAEVNTEKTKYLFMSCHYTTGQNHYVKVANTSFEDVAKLKYSGMLVTDENCIHTEIREGQIWIMRTTVQFRIFFSS